MPNHEFTEGERSDIKNGLLMSFWKETGEDALNNPDKYSRWLENKIVDFREVTDNVSEWGVSSGVNDDDELIINFPRPDSLNTWIINKDGSYYFNHIKRKGVDDFSYHCSKIKTKK